MDRCLLDFEEKGEDDFYNLKFESEKIKAVDLETGELFEYSKFISTKRVPKKKKLEFIVIQITAYKDGQECFSEEVFKKEIEARNFFDRQKLECEFFVDKNREGKVFDGRRYFWKIKDDKLTGDRGWS